MVHLMGYWLSMSLASNEKKSRALTIVCLLIIGQRAGQKKTKLEQNKDLKGFLTLTCRNECIPGVVAIGGLLAHSCAFSD